MQDIVLLGVLHALVLIILSWRVAKYLSVTFHARLCAAYIIGWSNLVFTSLALAAVSRLNYAGLYFGSSLLLAGALELIARRASAPILRPHPAASAPVDRALRSVLLTTLFVASLATALICFHYIPNNWDTITYRISRAFFYLAKGNLLHADSADPRISYYPFNGALLYLFLAQYQFAALWFNAVPAIAWVMAGVGTYSLSRRMGASPTGSLIAAWICVLTPGVLAHATSGNDEVLAAVPILAGIPFLIDWVSTGQKRFALVAAAAIGLGIGTKLLWIFYCFFVLVAAFVLLKRFASWPGCRTVLRDRMPAIIISGILAAPLAISFAVCNYVSVKQLSPPKEFTNQVLNAPFRLSLAIEKLRTSSAELLLSPIPDLVPPIHPERRQPEYVAFNKFFMDCCSSGLVEVTKVSPEGYQFRGPADQVYGFRPGETSVWLGFLPHLILAICCAAALNRKLPRVCLVPLIAFVLWVINYAMLNRYIHASGIYYAYAAVLAAAGLGPAWDFARTHRGAVPRFLLVAFLAVLGTQALLAGNLLTFGLLRNVKFVWSKDPEPAGHPVEPNVSTAIRHASKIYIPNTHWEVLYWNFMRFNLAARYSTGRGYRAPDADTLMLLSVAPTISDGMFPFRLPDIAAPALTFLGTAAQDYVFAKGDQVHIQHPYRSHYALSHVRWRKTPGGPVYSIDCCYGVEKDSVITVRFRLESPSGALQSDISAVGKTYYPPESDKNTYQRFVIEAASRINPSAIVRTVHPLDRSWNMGALDRLSPGAQEPVLMVRADLPREPYTLKGNHYTVSWLGKETAFSVFNPGARTEAVLTLELATLRQPHTPVLQAEGRTIGRGPVVKRVFWTDGTDIARYSVALQPGNNSFALTSAEPPDVLPDGRPASFLLIGEIGVAAAKGATAQ